MSREGEPGRPRRSAAAKLHVHTRSRAHAVLDAWRAPVAASDLPRHLPAGLPTPYPRYMAAAAGAHVSPLPACLPARSSNKLAAPPSSPDRQAPGGTHYAPSILGSTHAATTSCVPRPPFTPCQPGCAHLHPGWHRCHAVHAVTGGVYGTTCRIYAKGVGPPCCGGVAPSAPRRTCAGFLEPP